MTIRVSPALEVILKDAHKVSSKAYAIALKNALGANRRVICKMAPLNTPQEQVFNAGTVFRDASLSGEMVIDGDVIVRYGYTHDVTVCTAATMINGVSVLRIEGNGHWLEGLLGLKDMPNVDFILPANPTTTNSIAVTPNLRVKTKKFTPSGSTYSAPELDVDAPGYIIIRGYEDEANPKEIGRLPLNNRVEDWVFSDKEVAEGMGDIRCTLSTEVVTYDDIQFGVVMFSKNKFFNAEADVPVHQVCGLMMPTKENWDGYPRMKGYREGTKVINGANVKYGLSNTFPKAFKVEVYSRTDKFLGLLEMDRDGLPINSDKLQEFASLSKPLRPHMNCGQMLLWQSHELKMSPYSKKWFPGMDLRVLRPGMHKEKAYYRGANGMQSLGREDHALQNYMALGRWGCAINVQAISEDLCLDPYMYPMNPGNSGNTDASLSTSKWIVAHDVPESEMASIHYARSRLTGWQHEWGSDCGHDQVAGLGGVRTDRGVLPGAMMIHLSNPNFTFLRDNSTIKERIKSWNLGYMNHPIHWVTDLRTMSTIPIKEVFEGKWSLSKTFYGPNPSYTSGGTAYAIPIFISRLGSITTRNDRPHGGLWTDANKRMPWNHFGADMLHDYATPGDTALHYCSPAHAFSARFRYMVHMMLGLGDSNPNKNVEKYFATREHAWKIKQHSTIWKLRSEHPIFGVSGPDIEARAATELGQVYKAFYVPLWVEDAQDTQSISLKRFGTPIHWSSGSGKWTARSFGLTYYMSGILVLARQYGFFTKMWNRDEVTQKALLTIIRLLDAGSIEYFSQTNGSYMGTTGGGGVFGGPPYIPLDHTTAVNPTMPKDWKEWRDVKWPLLGKEDWIHNPDGTYNGPDSSEQLRASWPKNRLNYFRDIECLYPWTEVEKSAAVVEGFHKQWDDKVKQHVIDKLPVNSFRLKEWGIPLPYALFVDPINPDDVEPL